MDKPELICFLAVYFVFSGAMFWTAFCRLVMTNHATLMRIRVLLWAISAFSLTSIGATAIFGYIPGWLHMTFILFILSFQLCTARVWMNGVPYRYSKSSKQARYDRCIFY